MLERPWRHWEGFLIKGVKAGDVWGVRRAGHPEGGKRTEMRGRAERSMQSWGEMRDLLYAFAGPALTPAASC